MLFQFEDEKQEDKNISKRPTLPPDVPIDYELGFLFNFVSGKSTRFDVEPVLILKDRVFVEYKRISLNVERGLAFLGPIDDEFYNDLLEFSDRKLLEWMTNTGNRFIRNHSGTWAHTTARGLINLRKHYIVLLQKLWPKLRTWPHLFILTTGRFNFSKQKEVKLGEAPMQLSFTAEAEGNNMLVKMIVHLNGEAVNLRIRSGFMLDHQGTLYLPPSPESLDIINQFKNGPVTFPLKDKKDAVRRYLIPWMKDYPVTISDDLLVDTVTPAPQPRVHLSELNESNLMIRPQFMYDQVLLDYGRETSHVAEAGERLQIIQRDKATEDKLYEYLRTLHSSFANQRNHQYYYLPFDDVMKRSWFITMMRKLQQEDFVVTGLQELKKFRYTTEEPRINIDATSEADHFKLTISINWGKYEINLKEIRRAILNKQDTIMLDDGTLGHIPAEWISRYSLLLRTGTEENNSLRISKMHYTLLDDILEHIKGDSVYEEIQQKKKKLLEFEEIAKVPVSEEIKATLRPYQQAGFQWLQTLNELGWGACLADDMGLGKTLQTISFLQFLKEKYPGSTQLVVCPTSLIFNWETEMKKFCPTLSFHIYYGTQRSFDETHFNEYDVVLTTYGVVRNDQEQLGNFLWQYIILDESQAIKNPDALATRALLKLNAVNRVILSGTPLQNNTSDLFGQFHFLNPGLLGARDYFNHEFAQPIDRYGDKEKTRQLQRMVYPFILRRTKEQVAKDLPDKTITVLWCSMDAAQRKLYNHFRDNYRNTLLKRIDQDGIEKSGMFVLEGLLRLRQICDHPALLKDAAKDVEVPDQSVKTEELIREVKENVGDHKMLVFSQFTEMLQLIRQEFIDSGISFCYLDGGTALKKRKAEVERFQEDESVKVFLISLKAGGVGLNLTVADYVYLVDPWWNPAAEQQAIDRAHRIGQKRKVFAYKMICKDTVEEKILQMQERKRQLADDLIHEDSGFVKNLSRDDIEFLFG